MCVKTVIRVFKIKTAWSSVSVSRSPDWERGSSTETDCSWTLYCRNTTPSVTTFCHCPLTKSHIWSLSNTAQKNKTFLRVRIWTLSPYPLAKLHSSFYLHRCLEYVHTAQGHAHICTRDVLTWHKQNSHLLPFCYTPPHTHTDGNLTPVTLSSSALLQCEQWWCCWARDAARTPGVRHGAAGSDGSWAACQWAERWDEVH